MFGKGKKMKGPNADFIMSEAKRVGNVPKAKVMTDAKHAVSLKSAGAKRTYAAKRDTLRKGMSG